MLIHDIAGEEKTKGREGRGRRRHGETHLSAALIELILHFSPAVA